MENNTLQLSSQVKVTANYTDKRLRNKIGRVISYMPGWATAKVRFPEAHLHGVWTIDVRDITVVGQIQMAIDPVEPNKTEVHLAMTGHSMTIILNGEFVKTFQCTTHMRTRIKNYMACNNYVPDESSKLSFPWLAKKPTYDEKAESIAKEHLNIETLEEQGLDSLDFHEVGVCSLKKALAAAYVAGAESALQYAEKNDDMANCQMRAALGVFITCPETAALLKANDPKALEQATKAAEAYDMV